MDQFDKIDKSLFVPIKDSEILLDEIKNPPVSYWRDAWNRLKKDKVAMISLFVIIFIIVLSIVGPILSDYSYDEQIKGSEMMPPSAEHPFGTDKLGRDQFTRVMMGTRISLSIGFVSAIFTVIIGVMYGAFSGYKGGTIDMIMMRVVDVLYSIPTLLIVILLQVTLDPILAPLAMEESRVLRFIGENSDLFCIYFVLIALYWLDVARIVRGQVLTLKTTEYTLAARTLGASTSRVILKHLVPNCLGQIVVVATFKIPQAIFLEAFLSYIGLGVSLPKASLGSLIQGAMPSLYYDAYLIFFPALILSVLILCFNLLGDGLRDVLDPRLKNK